MFYRRILYLGQFAAAIILPTWVLISRGLLDDGIGWELLVYIIACPFLSIAMLAVGGLVAARRSVRAERSVSWLDAGLLTLWYAAIIAYGFWAWTTLAIAVVLLAIALLWSSGWQLFRETRARFRGLVAGFEQAAQAQGVPLQSQGDPLKEEAPRVIVINPESYNTDQQR